MLKTLFTGLICGALLGFVMQQGRFCLTGGFRDMYLAKNNRLFCILLIAIAIQSVGVYTLIAAEQFSYDEALFLGWALSLAGTSLVLGSWWPAAVRPVPGTAPAKG